MEKVKVFKERLKQTQSCQKSYTYVRRRPLEFEVDDWLYLKVSPMEVVMRFVKKEKLSPRYIGPYRISKRVGNVAYELELPKELEEVHSVFHVSMSKKCLGDTLLIVPTENVGIKHKLSYEEILVHVFDHQLCKLITKEVAWIKGNIHGSLGGFEWKIGEEKSENPSERPWGAAPRRDPKNRLYPSRSEPPRQTE
ncbi:uncharacterized protein LOC107019429 [Solanum pennellii]|uniref:Uncharacterized protein LOC107019429 n=1 Tax=Solanum pennellii TaxID=28526 RepID=A0ABM1GST1_SOLPN|nr:uncharacterized protein LOC107019429 [Solanum pennellii]